MSDVETRLAELQERADELNLEPTQEALELNEEILRLGGVNVVATRRLAGILIQLGHLERAQEVLEEALEPHPDDRLLLRRTDDLIKAYARREREAQKKTTRSRGAAPTGPRTWIKAVHYAGDDWSVAPGEETFVSDPGRRSAAGERAFTAAGEPWGRPSWSVGDEVGLYFAGTKKVPVLVEITAPPTFEPDLVQSQEWAGPDAGERWPWVTRIRGLKAKPVGDAPSLTDLEVPHESMQQRARLLTSTDIHQRLVQALG